MGFTFPLGYADEVDAATEYGIRWPPTACLGPDNLMSEAVPPVFPVWRPTRLSRSRPAGPFDTIGWSNEEKACISHP